MISLEHITRRFGNQKILENASLEFHAGKRYAIMGANGSGKSTLLQILSGFLSPTSGHIIHTLNGKKIPREQLYLHVAYAAPYIDPPEELTLREVLDFHRKFKPVVNGWSTRDIIDMSTISSSADKQIRHFSSGMKQRVRLLLAITSDVPLLLLDEPGSNLDKAGEEWFNRLVNHLPADRLVVVASNYRPSEYGFCHEFSAIEEGHATPFAPISSLS